MADKPSKALVVYGEGLAPLVSPSHPHLHSLASRACCGFLALDISTSSSDIEDERLVSELAGLLDAREAHCSGNGKAPTTLSQRFMGMRVALVTDNLAARDFGEKLGLTVIQFDRLRDGETIAAPGLLKLLGFEDGKLLETSEFDLVIVHVGSHSNANGQSNDVDSANNLVGQILEITQSGSEVRSRLYLSVVMSYGQASEGDLKKLYPSIDQNNSNLKNLVPRQSYAMKGVNLRDDIRQQGPMLVAQWQEAVTRKDKAEMFSFEEFTKHSGNLAIPADRFVHEIAFKLWKAPKYGA